jgi:hypothetical protein
MLQSRCLSPAEQKAYYYYYYYHYYYYIINNNNIHSTVTNQ